jgi:hypothetical protein
MIAIKARHIYGIGCVLFAASAFAGAVIPVYEVKESAGSYLETQLTRDIYRYTPQGNLHNLVVLDNEGNKLPYLIHKASPTLNEVVKTFPVNFYPVAAGSPTENLKSLGHTSIRITEQSVAVDVIPRSTDSVAAPVDFYLLDFSSTKHAIDSLIIDWQASEAHQYLEVTVSGTQDLQRWTSLSQNTLVQLEKDGQKLLRNKIVLDLAAQQYPYLRLAFVRGGARLKINGIRMENRADVTHPTPVEIWRVNGELAEEQNTVVRASNIKEAVAAWEFTRDDSAPISSFSLHLGEDTYGDSVKVFTRATSKTVWEIVYQGIWFNTKIGDAWQHSEALTTANNSHRFWRVELVESARTRVQPSLEFQRAPDALRFIANQRGPYQIALDQQSSTNHQHAIAQIFLQLSENKRHDWQQVELIPLRPDAALFAQKTSINWATWIFWGILVSAVALLVGFAMRLFKHMNSTRDAD